MTGSFLKSTARNFIIVTVVVVALAILLSRSEDARQMLAPPGVDIPANPAQGRGLR
jgi:hypothetical protein